METENGFRITTYKKKDLACLYCPNATARCAIRTLTRWIKRNHELYEALAHTGYNVRTRTFMPKQVSLIVQYIWTNLNILFNLIYYVKAGSCG